MAEQLEPTVDPYVVIVERRAGYVRYRYIEPHEWAGTEWVVEGVCDRVGECEVGNRNPDLVWTGIPIGQPGAVYDRRYDDQADSDEFPPDNPVTPEGIVKWPNCSLRGRWVE